MTSNYTKLSSLQPFLIRAFNEWAYEQNFTPQIAVTLVENSGLLIPDYLYKSDCVDVIFNISPKATRDLVIDNKSISFYSNFKGQSHYIYIPIHLVELIFLKENISIGMAFDCEQEDIDDSEYDFFEEAYLAQTNTKKNHKWIEFKNQKSFKHKINLLVDYSVNDANTKINWKQFPRPILEKKRSSKEIDFKSD